MSHRTCNLLKSEFISIILKSNWSLLTLVVHDHSSGWMKNVKKIYLLKIYYHINQIKVS